MTKKMLIDAAHPEEVRVALIDQGKVEDFDFESEARKPLRGNIYLARVTRVEPSLQAAFIEYGGNRHGFLAFSEIHPDYYQIPVSDRKLLQEAEAEVAKLAAQLELYQSGDEYDDLIDEDDQPSASSDEASDETAQDDDQEQPADIEAVSDVIEESNTPSEEVEVTEDASDDAASIDQDAASESEQENDKKIDEEEEEEEAEENSDNDQSKSNAADQSNDPSDTETVDAAKDTDVAEEIVEDDTDDADKSASTQSDQPDAERVENTDEDADDVVASDAEESSASTKDAKKKKRETRAELFERYKEAKRKRSRLLRNYKIQEVVKRRQILLVQVVKEERGGKGAALTTYMSLAGRYCVLMPNTARGGGISRKIAMASDRKRLRRVVGSLEVPQGMGLIIRTAGAKRTKTEVKRDYDYLLRLWENIRTLTLKSVAPCLIYEEASLIKRAIRDLYDKDISSVLVEGEEGYREAKDFMKMLMPSHAKNVQPYKDRAPIFLKHNIESQLDGMYLPTVRLKSGGYIVIHQTEALIAIDVNSGRATRERNIELTALKTNVEAAQEAARQFRLRDLAGLIVLDFIDMEEPRNNRKVEKALKDALKSDRARLQVGRISMFGLLELSRQRRRSGIIDGTTHSCPTCSGAGFVRSHEIAALRILRAIEGEAISGKVGLITARTSLDVSLYILNHNRSWLEHIEQLNGVKVEILADSEKSGDAFDLEKSGTPQERVADTAFVRPDQLEPAEVAKVDESDVEATNSSTSDAEEQPDGVRKRRRRRKRKKDTPASADASESQSSDSTEDEQPREESAEQSTRSDNGQQDNGQQDGSQPDGAQQNGDQDDEEAPKRRRRRGRRGGRRNRRNKEEMDAKSEETVIDADQPASPSSDETDETATVPSAETPAEVVDTPKKKAPRSPRRRSNGRDDAMKAAPAAETPPDDAPKVEEAAAAPKIESEVAPEVSEAPKPVRKGWWKRAIG